MSSVSFSRLVRSGAAAAVAAALLLGGPATAPLGPGPLRVAADDKPKGGPKDPLAALAERTGCPVEVLRETKAERYLSNDIATRRAFLKDAIEKPRFELFGLIAYIVENDKDRDTQVVALRSLSIFGLLADRDEVLRILKPLLERSIDKGGVYARFALEETERLNRWFRWDAELAPVLVHIFDGDDFNLRSMAFRGLCDLRHEKVVEETVKPICWKVYRSTKVSLFDRRQAIRALVYYKDRGILPEMQKNLRGEGSVAIESAWGLVRMLDPSSLAELRKIDQKAVHRLRFPCWLARCLLDDPTCLDEVVKVVADKNEHPEVKRHFLGYLGDMPSWHKAKDVLEKVWKADASEPVRLGCAIAFLKIGDTRGLDLLEKRLLAPWEDDQSLRGTGHGWMRQLRFIDEILRIKSKEAGRLYVAMFKIEPKPEDLIDPKDKKGERYVDWWRHGSERNERLVDWYAEYKADAVSACGEIGLADTLPALREIAQDKLKGFGHLRFHAIVSCHELGDGKAASDLKWFLPRYEDGLYADVYLDLGPMTIYGKRLKWSTIFDVCGKAERVKDHRYLALLEELLKTEEQRDDPMAAGWARKVEGGEGGAPADPGATGTVVRGPAGGGGKDAKLDPLERPPEVRYRCRNQFVRRAIALAAAEIANDEAAPQLARALRDSRAVVRAAALEEIGRITSKYTLHRGASAEEEHAVWANAVAWLKAKKVWPD